MRVSVLTMRNRVMLWCDLLLARVAVALGALVAPLGEALAVERVAARKDHHRRRLHRIARRPPRRAGGGGPREEGGRECEQGDAQCRTAPSVGTLWHSLLVGRAGGAGTTYAGVLPARARVSAQWPLHLLVGLEPVGDCDGLVQQLAAVRRSIQ
jgi:hypothetical protein